MEPTLRPGDRLLVSYRRAVSPGAVVVARFADGTVAVKRARERRTTRVGGPGWWLTSDNPGEGVDSRHRGPVADSDVIAVTVARIWPRPRRL
jgi:phage repressor protein C with HTH and peptisase S24 domain